jgi:hypothetical protein
LNEEFVGIAMDFTDALKREIRDRAAMAAIATHAEKGSTPVGITFGAGFYEDEMGARWMSYEGSMFVWRESLQTAQQLTFELTCGQSGYYPTFPFTVQVVVDTQPAYDVEFTSGQQTKTITIPLPVSPHHDLTILLRSEATFVPASFWTSSDSRSLSVYLNHVRLSSLALSPEAEMNDWLDWQCNICGALCHTPLSALWRELPSCPSCQSTVRFRAIVHLLSMELFGKSLILDDFPVDKAIRGAGLSDWEGYADRLAQKLEYTNTFYHQAPKLDITNIDPAQEGTLDFLICTEVFEHVPPPVSTAFANAWRLLKPSGVLIAKQLKR